MKTYTLNEVQDKLIGEVGTPGRDKFEYELQMDLIDSAIKQARKEQHMTQEELGKLVGCRRRRYPKWKAALVTP